MWSIRGWRKRVRRSRGILEDKKQLLEVLEESIPNSSFQGIWEDCVLLTSCWYGIHTGKHCKILAIQLEMKVKN